MIIAALVAVSSLSANAQVWVGGQLGFNYNTDERSNYPAKIETTTFSIAPEVGYTLDENWDLAIALEEGYRSVKDGNSSNTFKVTPYARYTFFKTGQVGFFLDMGFNVGVTSYKAKVGPDPENATTWGIGVRPGVKFAASDKVTFVASVGLLGFQQWKQDKLKESDLGFNVNGNALQFGLYYSF